MGRSGSGKSTLLRQMGLIDRPTSGSIVFDSKDVTKLMEGERAKLRLGYLGYVFQEYALLGELTTLQNVYLPGMMLNGTGNYKSRAKELLELVGLGQRVAYYPKELSGGEQQRVAIARALAKTPSIVLADEPTGNLDSKSGREIISILTDMHKQQNVTMVIITHDINVASRCQRIIRIRDGELISGDE